MALRMSMVTVTYLLVVLVPHLGLMVSLLGSLSGSLLAIVFPVLIDLKLRRAEKGCARFTQLAIAVVATGIGLVACVTGTASSLIAIEGQLWHPRAIEPVPS